MGIFDVLRGGLAGKSTTVEDEVAAVVPIEGAPEQYAPHGDQAAKEATDKWLAEGDHNA